MDGAFKKLRDLMKNERDLAPFLLNTTSAGELVPEIECRIRVIKERVRAEKASLLYTYYPIVMVVSMNNFVVTWLNVFPLANGIWNMSPRLIISGTI